LGLVVLSALLAALPFGLAAKLSWDLGKTFNLGNRCAPFHSALAASSLKAPPPLWISTGAPWEKEVRAEIEHLAAEHPGEISVYVHDLIWGQELGYRAQTPRYLASGVKLLVLVEVFKQQAEGKLRFDERIVYQDAHIRDGSPDLNKRNRGIAFPIAELTDYMIRNSDNAASDMLIERVGLAAIKETMAELGLTSLGELVPLMDVRRWVYTDLDPRAAQLSTLAIRDVRWRDHHHPRLDLLKEHIGEPKGNYGEAELEAAYDRYYALGRNHLSMADAGLLLAGMAQGRLINEKSSDLMFQILATVWNSGNRAWGALAPNTTVAHKTGSQRRRICDLAVLQFPDGSRVVLTMAVTEGDYLDAEAIIQRLTQRVWQAILRDRRLRRGEAEAPGFATPGPTRDRAMMGG
jgi:beta-lactamase class A